MSLREIVERRKTAVRRLAEIHECKSKLHLEQIETECEIENIDREIDVFLHKAPAGSVESIVLQALDPFAR